jgi:hypothetical protein
MNKIPFKLFIIRIPSYKLLLHLNKIYLFLTILYNANPFVTNVIRMEIVFNVKIFLK